jgi:alkylation response protein AidB-like acyl-CoA dehydrogenase
MSADAYRGLDLKSRQMVVDTVRQLRKKMLNKENILEWDKDEIFPEAAIREMLGPGIGLQLLFIPEEYGGAGGGARDCCKVTQEMAKICLGVATGFFRHPAGDRSDTGRRHPGTEKALAHPHCRWQHPGGLCRDRAGGGQQPGLPENHGRTGDGRQRHITGYKITGNKQFISTGGYADS